MKRTKTAKCANPLFEKWLTEWKDEAGIQRKEKLQHCFTNALTSLRKYQLPLERGKDCLILQYFGPKICAMLDKRLDQHLKTSNVNLPTLNLDDDDDDDDSSSTPKKSKRSKKLSNSDDPPSRKRSERTFIPKSGSACHALLTTLYRKSKTRDYVGYMTKTELQSEAQPYSECSLTKSQPDSFYTGWSSMSTLIEKGLVKKSSSPAKYSLTDSGEILAKAISDSGQPALSETLFESSIYSKEDAQADLELVRPREHALSSYALNYCGSSDVEITATTSTASLTEDIITIDLDSIEFDSKSCSVTVQSRLVEEVSQSSRRKRNKKQNENQESVETQCGMTQNIAQEPKRKGKEGAKRKETQTVKETNSNPESIFFLEPNSFDVILLVDTQETSGKAKQKNDATLAELTQFNVQFEVRHLKVGDFAWIARCRKTNNELILPHIVERKRIDDLDKSIQDGRFHEQKFRLKQSGIKNLIYMVESYGKNQHTSIPLKSLLQASVNSLVQDGFIVKYTDSHKDSMKYLSILTNMLRKVYSGKRLSSGEKEDLNSIDLCNNSEPLMEFKKFNKSSSKVKTLKVKEMLVRQLLQIKGISVEKALAIVEVYPTPKLLSDALNYSGKDGEKLLAPLQFGVAKRQIGPAVSKIIYQLYTLRILN